jgi:hypothetical protein
VSRYQQGQRDRMTIVAQAEKVDFTFHALSQFQERFCPEKSLEDDMDWLCGLVCFGANRGGRLGLTSDGRVMIRLNRLDSTKYNRSGKHEPTYCVAYCAVEGGRLIATTIVHEFKSTVQRR